MDNYHSGNHSENSRPISGLSLNGGASFRGSPGSVPGTPVLSMMPPATVIVNKDGGGYGMKVSGDKPVYVQSVKEGGAAQRAGLHSGDKIIKVNGVDVTESTHTEVVALIRSSNQVKLTVQQFSHRSMGSARGPQIVHGTPMAGRAGITAPLPVNHEKMRQLEYERVQTLRLMLDEEEKYLKVLETKGKGAKRVEREKTEARMKTLQDQIKALGNEGSPVTQPNLYAPPHLSPEPVFNPPFLSRFPRSLSNLSLGGRSKKSENSDNKNDKNQTKNSSKTGDTNKNNKNSKNAKNNKKDNKKNDRKSGTYSELSEINENKINSGRSVQIECDSPPPLPQRNKNMIGWNQECNSRLLSPGSDGSTCEDLNSPIFEFHGPNTDLDISNEGLVLNLEDNSRRLSNCRELSQSTSYLNSRRQIPKNFNDLHFKNYNSKTKNFETRKKINVDVNKSFLMNERNSNINFDLSPPPPLPPRLDKPYSEDSINNRPLPNSINTLFNYPLVSTCTAAICNNNTVLKPRPLESPVVEEVLPSKTPNPNMSHRRALSSPEPIATTDSEMVHDRHQKSSSGSWEAAGEATPPGTPPPPYPSPLGHEENTDTWDHVMAASSPLVGSITPSEPPDRGGTVCHIIQAAQTHLVQQPIISMEDDDISDTEQLEEHGPFKSLSRLLEHPAHVAVFLNYLLTNSQPSSLLFYLITDLYKEGNAKDMRKWAYEIHSTFLVPGAPLQIMNVAESVAREIDDVLLTESDKEEIMRRVFFKARTKAKEELTAQLNEFQVKRTVGLATMFGPSDCSLDETIRDKTKELKVVETFLLPKLDNYLEEIERDRDRESTDLKKQATGYALATVLLRWFKIQHGAHGSPISGLERCPTFVSREKTFKSKLIGKGRKFVIKGHHLLNRQYYVVTYCNQCQNIIWGIGPQGYHCTDCELNIHRVCSKVLDEDCLGPHTHNKSKAHQSDRISKFMGKIRPTHHFIGAERTRRQEEESMEDSSQTNERPTSVSLGRNPSDRRPEHPVADKSEGADGGDPVDHEMVNESPKPCKSAPVSVNRSESYKERLSQKRNMRNQRRKTSDPNLSKTSDDALDITALSQATCSGSSSTCSLSSSSPQSLSLETVGGPGGRSHGTAVDSDDAEEGSDWASLVPPEVLARLSDKEKKRQEVINELIQTERSHVRKLRLLERLFYRPLLESGLLPLEQLQLLFPQSFKSLQELHGSFSQRIKQRQKEGGHLVGFIGDLLISMFDGPAGEELKASAASFCERQQIALEGLKERRRKDGRLQSLLNEAESDQACRRLQLKDLLPTGHQRLTKYPLLFESLVKCYDKDTLESDPNNETELQSIQRAVELSKQILNHVNHAVRVAEDRHRLQTIQKKLDRSGFDKAEHPIAIEFRSLDLTQHRLIYEGTLILRLDGKRLQLHAVLLNEVIVLLQKQDDKYLMKFHQGGAGGSEGSRIERASPIIKLATLIIREKATDKNTFFLIVTSHSQMYEFVTQTTSEYKAWFKHISEAAEAYKSKPKLPFDVDTDSLQDTSIVNTSLDSASIDNNLDNASNDTSVTDTVADNPSESSEFEKIAHNDIDTQSRTDTEGSISVDNGESDVTKDDKRLSGEVLADGDSVTGTQYLTQTSSLVAPSEVKISVSPVHLAEPVLTTYERLRRADIAVKNALELKQRIVGEILSIPPEDYTVIADMASMGSAAKEPTEIILNALQQAQQLTHIINDSYTVNEQQVVLSTQLKTNTWSQLCDKCEFKSKEMDMENIETCNDENSEPELVEATNLLVDQVVLSDTILSDGSTSIINAQEIMEMTESGEIFEDAVGNIEHKNHDGGIFSQFGQTCRGCDFVDQQVKPVVPTHKVLDVANDINSTLTQLLQIVRERDNEREALRKELQRCRELLHHFHGQASQFSNDDVTTPECAEKTEDTIN